MMGFGAKKLQRHQRTGAMRKHICRSANVFDHGLQVSGLSGKIIAVRLPHRCCHRSRGGRKQLRGSCGLSSQAIPSKNDAVDTSAVHAHQGRSIRRHIRAGIFATGNRGARILDRKIHVVPPSSMLIQLHVSAVGWTRIALRLVNRLTVPDPILFHDAASNEQTLKNETCKAQSPHLALEPMLCLRHNCLEEHMPMSTFLNASPIFGPVRSRRLGLSLGVNMMPASGKICTFDCIYCENGLNAERPCHEPYNTAAVVLDALEAKAARDGSRGRAPRCDHLRRQRRAHRRTGVSAGHRRCRRAARSSWPQTPKSPCSPTARAPTAPKCTTRS